MVDFILKPVVFERLRDTLEKYRQSIAALAALADIDQQAVDTLFGTPLQQVAAGDRPGHRCSHPAAGAGGPDSRRPPVPRR